MKSLIILAHPSSDGLSRKISSVYIDKLKESNRDFELIDLYVDWRQDFFNFEDRTKIAPMPKTHDLQKKIKDSDEIVFIFPLWWWGMPAIMKNFIDCNFTPGFAYKYTAKWPVWLLRDKKAKVIATCDAPWIFYKIFPLSLKYFFKFMILWFCWIKLVHFELIDKVRERRNTKLWIDKIHQKVVKIALK